MRSSYVVWNVHGWLSRVVFERDRVDERLFAYAATDRLHARILSSLVQSLALPGRVALRVLMLVESLVNSVFLRHLELEADRYQVRVAGTEAFIAGSLPAETAPSEELESFPSILPTETVSRWPALKKSLRSYRPLCRRHRCLPILPRCAAKRP